MDIAVGAAFFASGAVALTLEIAWIRKASLVFGATSFGLSTVLAVFFAGLALGSYALGRVSARSDRPLRLYAVLEFAVGILGIASPAAFGVADSIYHAAYPRLFENFAALSALRFLCLVGILLPPTFLMGGTLPLLARQYVRRENRVAGPVAGLYALNSLGAAAGALATGFVWIPRLGVDASMRLAGVVGCGIGLAVAAVSWKRSIEPLGSPVPPATAIASEPTPAARFVPLLFFASGFVALGNEVVWARFLSLLLHNTVYTYTLTLAVVLVGIGVGSLLSGRWLDRIGGIRGRARLFGAIHVLLGLVVLGSLYLPVSFWRTWADPERLGSQLALVSAVLLLPALLSGVSFPLAIRMVVERPGLAGPSVGRLSALNTAGGILGSLGIGFVFLPMLGLDISVRITTALSLAIGVAAWWLLVPGSGVVGRWALSLGAVACWVWIPVESGLRLPADYLGPRESLIDFREGVGAHLAVIERQGKRELEIDRLWQGEDGKSHQILAAHIPMLLHPDPKRILAIGLGPGQTASRFLLYPIERLDCVEIERELISLVEDHFDADWMRDARTRFIVEDGRSYIDHADAQYDVISIEVGQTFRPGLAAFYTVEFYERARERLHPGGLASQFVPIHFLSLEQFESVVASFVHVFPHSVLWYNRGELLLIGRTDGPVLLQGNRLQELENEALARDLAFSHWGGPRFHVNRPENFAAAYLVGAQGLAAIATGAAHYRDDRPVLDYETSYRGAGQEVAILSRIRGQLDPIGNLISGAPPVWGPVSESIRALNLANIGARMRIRAGLEFQSRGEHRDAARIFARALADNPENVWARYNLAESQRRMGRLDSAAAGFSATLERKPDFPEAFLGLARSLDGLGRRSEAQSAFLRSVELDPSQAPAWLALGDIADSQGDEKDAVRYYREALVRRPDWSLPLNNLAWLLATSRDPTLRNASEALQLARRAAEETQHRDAAVLDTLAAAHAASGETRMAVEVAEAALERIPAGDRSTLRAQIEGRLAEYRTALDAGSVGVENLSQ